MLHVSLIDGQKEEGKEGGKDRRTVGMGKRDGGRAKGDTDSL
jgi:hypothetical protein